MNIYLVRYLFSGFQLHAVAIAPSPQDAIRIVLKVDDPQYTERSASFLGPAADPTPRVVCHESL